MTTKYAQSLNRVYLLVCKGESCEQRGNPEKIRVALKQAIRDFPARSVKVSYVSCLGLCGDGPNVLVFAGGTAFGQCDAGELQEVIQAVGEKLGKHRA